MENVNNLDELKAFLPRYFKYLEPVKNKTVFTCKVRVYNYFDMLVVATNLVKLCGIATDSQSPEISNLVHNRSVDVSRILELALQFMPLDIAELADEIKEMLPKEQ